MDRAGRTSLHYAALENDTALVADLIAGRADLNAADKAGYTPLHFAAQQGSIEAATLLLQAGAAVDPRDGAGTTPLLRAVLSAPAHRGEMILLLRRHGADPLASDVRGGTPVGWAREISNYDLAQYFTDVPHSPPAAVDTGARDSAQQGAHRPQTDHAPETGWQAEFARLWDELVPPRGQARTVQGELIRCVGRLTDEAYRNGNQNWSAESGTTACSSSSQPHCSMTPPWMRSARPLYLRTSPRSAISTIRTPAETAPATTTWPKPQSTGAGCTKRWSRARSTLTSGHENRA